jgi:choline kinase
MDVIIPAAGLASRMNGLPKFLLPIDESASSLILRHIRNSSVLADQVWVPTRPEYCDLLTRLLGDFENVNVYPALTRSMTETLQTTLTHSMANRFSIFMPDTYFWGEQPYEWLISGENECKVATWNIRKDQNGKLGQVLVKYTENYGEVIDIRDKDPDCEWSSVWGAFTVNREELIQANPNLNPGEILNSLIIKKQFPFARRFDGAFYDCGTALEYFSLTANFASGEKNPD